MPKADIDAIELRTGSSYPADVAAPVENRRQKSLGDAEGLTQFSANLVILQPGTPTEICHYNDIDMMITDTGTNSTFTRKDGSPYEGGKHD